MDTVHTTQEEINSFLNTNFRISFLCGGTLNILNVYLKTNFQMTTTGKKTRSLLKLSLRSFITAYLLTILIKKKRKTQTELNFN